MCKIKINTINASDIAKFLNCKLIGKDIQINGVSTIEKPKKGTVLFLTEIINSKFNFSETRRKYFKSLSQIDDLLFICDSNSAQFLINQKIISKSPRLDFIKVLKRFFIEKEDYFFLTEKDIQEKYLNKNITVLKNSFIGKDVKIGSNTLIMNNVVLYGKVKIGNNCIIKPNTVIGNQGFSYVYENNKLVHFPHIGDVRIGNDVCIGSNVCIDRGTINSTIIQDDVKIDDLVQIGHNSIIKKLTQITAGAIICGRAVIGKGVWIAPNSVIDNGVKIGNDSLVGTSSVVRTNVKSNSVVAGIPARYIRKVK